MQDIITTKSHYIKLANISFSWSGLFPFYDETLLSKNFSSSSPSYLVIWFGLKKKMIGFNQNTEDFQYGFFQTTMCAFFWL